MELYLDRGYEQTTVAEIAARAGLTERTFFRHFADKREVLFRGSELAAAVAEAIDGAPDGLDPLEAVAAGLLTMSEFFADRRPHARTRQAVIDANPGLRERELIKLASMGRTTADALGRRGVAASAANLAAEIGIAVFKVAFERWLDDDADRPLGAHIVDGFAELRFAAQRPQRPTS